MRFFKSFIKILSAIIVVLALLIVIGAIYAQSKLNVFFREYVKREYGLSLKIGSAHLQFYPLSVGLQNIELSDSANKPFFHAAAASAALPYSSFWSDEFVVNDITVVSPALDLDRLPEFRRAKTTSGAGPKFRVERLSISTASIAAKGHDLQDIFVEARFDGNSVNVSEARASFQSVAMKAKGTIEFAEPRRINLSYNARGDTKSFADLIPVALPLSGPFTAAGVLEGEITKPVFSGRIEGQSLTWNRNEPFAVTAKYRYEVGNHNTPIHLEAQWKSLPLEVLRTYFPESPQTSSVSAGTLEYSGALDDIWSGKAVLRADITEQGGRIPLRGSARASLTSGIVKIESANLNVFSSGVNATGIMKREEMNLDLNFRIARSSDISFLEPKLAAAPGSYEGSMSLSGLYSDPVIQGQLRGRSDKSNVAATIFLHPSLSKITLEVQGDAAAADLRKLVPQLDEGKIHFEGSASGNWKNPRWEIHARGANLQVRESMFRDVRLEAEGLGPNARFDLEAPDIQLVADGSYQLRSKVFAIHGATSGVSLSQLAAFAGKAAFPVEGEFKAQFEASGDLDRWEESKLQVAVDETELRYRNARVRVTQAKVYTDSGKAIVQLDAEATNTVLHVQGAVSLRRGYPLELEAQSVISAGAIQNFTGDWKGDGTLRVNVKMNGTLSHPLLEGVLESEDLALTYLPKNLLVSVEHLRIGLSQDAVDVNGNGRLNEAPFSCSGKIPLRDEMGAIQFEISNLPLATFVESSGISGTIHAKGDLHGRGFPFEEWEPGAFQRLPFHEWTGEISIDPADLKLQNAEIKTNEALRLSVDSRSVRLQPVHIQSGDFLDLTTEGSVNLNSGAIDGAVQMNAKVELLSSLRADIQSSGPITLDLRVGGTLAKPTYNGNIALRNASIRIPESPLFVEDLTLEASVDGNAIRIVKMQARSGGGTITGGGEIVRGKTGSYIALQGKNVAMMYPEGLRSQLDFDLKLSKEGQDFLLAGDINVLRSFYEQQLNLRNPILRKLMASKKELGVEKQLKNRFKFNLNIKTVQDLQIKNNLARLRGYASLNLGGSLYRPHLSGKLSVREGGRFYLVGNQFDVEKMSILFYRSESFEPDLDVALTSVIHDAATDNYYEVHLPFSGSISNIEFHNLRSTPSLSQDQIFSLIAQGTTESEQAGGQGAMLRGQILSALAGQALGAPGTFVARTLGLSRIQVQQEGLSSENDPKTRLVLGKDIGPDFTLIYSVALNESEDQTWIASYRYRKNIVGRFIDQSDGTVTASVNHRIPFGKGSVAGGPEQRSNVAINRISTIQITNNSTIADEEIRRMLGLSAGEVYDYWKFQDRSREIQKRLQDLGYISPSVDIREETRERQVAVSVEIRPGLPGTMAVHGFTAGKKQNEYYRSLWGQGLSPVIVQQLIQEDLLRQLRMAGYHQSTVTTRQVSSEAGDRADYHFDVNPGRQFPTVNLEFKNSGHYVPTALQKDLRSLYESSGQMFIEAIHDFSAFQEKIQALYLQHGYVRTAVTAGPVSYQSGTGVIARNILIDEGPLSRISTVIDSEGNPLPDALEQRLTLRPNQAFSLDGLLEDELTIRNFFEGQGYGNVSAVGELEFEKDSPDIRVKWDLEKGAISRIADVRVNGNQSTRTGMILNLAGFKAGEPFTAEARSRARKKLSALGVFQTVTIEKEDTDVPGECDIVIRVVENKRYEFQYGGRYNTDDGIGGEVRLTDSNWLGRAQNLSLYLRYSLDLPIYRVDYILPVTGSFWDRTRFSFFHDDRTDHISADVNGDFTKVPFQVQETDFQFQQDYRFGPIYRFIWGFDYGDSTADFEDLDNGLPLSFSGTAARFRGALVADHRDDPLNAQKGRFLSAELEYAPSLFGSDINYEKFYTQFFFYRKLGPIVLATGARAGFLSIRNNILSIGEKFRAGGSSTLRGFDQNAVVPGDDVISIFFGGDSVFIINEELRFPIYKWFSGAVFYDGGNVYQHSTDFDITNLRNSAGFGIRVGAAGLLFRFDLGFNLQPRNAEPHAVFHFGIGQAF